MVQLSEKFSPFCGLAPAWQPLSAQFVASTVFTEVNKDPGFPEQAPPEVVPGLFPGLLSVPSFELLLQECNIRPLITSKNVIRIFFIDSLFLLIRKSEGEVGSSPLSGRCAAGPPHSRKQERMPGGSGKKNPGACRGQCISTGENHLGLSKLLPDQIQGTACLEPFNLLFVVGMI